MDGAMRYVMGSSRIFWKPGHFSSRHVIALHSAHSIPSSKPVAEGKKYQISINVNTAYLAEQSDPSSDRYVFAYTITIANTGTVSAQLISRHWIITDADNVVQEVKGLGVVGEQPLLRPGESFEYTSGTAMATPVGTMHGTYQMVAEDGNKFDAEIPVFTLSMPRVLH
jgi:ApaG protein